MINVYVDEEMHPQNEIFFFEQDINDILLDLDEAEELGGKVNE